MGGFGCVGGLGGWVVIACSLPHSVVLAAPVYLETLQNVVTLSKSVSMLYSLLE